MRYPNPTPAPPGRARDQARQAWRRPQRQGHARTFPFPNPEAKTASADGTAPARVWESRTPPPAHHKRGGPATGPPFSRTHTATPATRTRPHRPHTGHTRTRPATHPHGHTGHREPHHVRGHTRKHTAKFATPHRIFERRVWARAFVWADGVERGWACVGLLTASRALSALFAAEPLVSQSLEGPLSGRGSGSVVRVLTRV